MSFVLTVWECPAGAPAPHESHAADALLAQQQAAPEAPSPRISAWADALRERFPPDEQGLSEFEGWVGEHTGPTENFGLRTRSPLFLAAYQHAVVQARRHGLNIYDPQSGEHHLATGERLPAGEPAFDELSADMAWHQADWGPVVQHLRDAVRRNSRCALHDLGRCYAEGHGVTRQLMLAGALMQLAAAPDDIRRRQRLDTLKAWPAEFRDAQTALRDRLRSAGQGLAAIEAAIDAEVDAALNRRAQATHKREPVAFDDADWWALREAALDGDEHALERLAYKLGPHAEMGGRPPWPLEPDAYTQHWRLAAARDTAAGARIVASGLLSGLNGWPLDPAQALYWMRRARALAGPVRTLDAPLAGLTRRLASGWNPAQDRARADALLQEAARTLGAHRLALLRQACELDHPEAWQRLGTAYQRGDLGLKADDVLGAALHLHAQKELSATASELGWTRPAALAQLAPGPTGDALALCRQLIGNPTPWATLEAFQHELDHSTIVQVSAYADAGPRVEMLDGRRRPMAPSSASRATAAASPESPHDRQATAPRDAAWHAGHFALLLGATLPLWAWGTGAHRGWMLAGGLLALYGAWRSGQQFDWPVGKRLAVGLAACVPGLGLLAAASVWLAQWQRVSAARAAPDADTPPPR